MQLAVKVEQAEIVGRERLLDPAVVEHDLVGRVGLQVDQRAHHDAGLEEAQVAVVVPVEQALIAAAVLVVVGQVELVGVRHRRDDAAGGNLPRDQRADERAVAQAVDLFDHGAGQGADVDVLGRPFRSSAR